MRKPLYTLSVFLMLFGFAKAQTISDTLTLSSVVTRILQTYPSVTQAEEAIQTAAVQAEMARSVYLPNIAGKAAYSYIDPISALTLGDQTIHIQSHHNASVGISISQLIWDFGKSRPHVEATRLEKELAILQKRQLMQSLALQGIRAYYLTAFSRHSIQIKEEQLRNFGQMLEQTRIRKESGSATNFDYLNTNAGLQAVKSELIALATNKEKNYISLGTLADTIISDATPLSLSFNRSDETRSLDELVQYALTNRLEMRMMAKEIEIARLQEKTASRAFNPNLSAGVSGGFNNGYEPNINRLRANISAGATLQIPIYEGGKRKQERALASAAIRKAVATRDLTAKQITQQIADGYYTLMASAASIEQLKIQTQVSEEAFQQARVNYHAGAATNLELLTSETNATNARLMLLQEEINYQLAWYQLMVNLGVAIDNPAVE